MSEGGRKVTNLIEKEEAYVDIYKRWIRERGLQV